jgi:thioredoxin 1
MSLKYDRNLKEDALAQGYAVVVDFWAPWCGPCRRLGPTFEAVAESRKDIVFLKANLDEEADCEDAADVAAIPCVKIFLAAGAPPAHSLVGGRAFEFEKLLPARRP